MTISYLGPAGSFTEQALALYDNLALRSPCSTVRDALEELQADKCQKCIIPIENSTEGIVNGTIDAVIFDYNFRIENMVILPITQNLLVKKGVQKEMVKTVLSHPQGLAQCEKYLNRNFSHADRQAASSTSQAARIAAESNGELAAIASEINATVYGLEILDRAIQDNRNNQTAFIVVSKDIEKTDSHKKQASLVFSTENRPGDLYRILNIFALWEINIIKIFSRPMKDNPGSYAFYVDIENSCHADLLGALEMVKRKVSFFKYFGAYDVMDLTKML